MTCPNCGSEKEPAGIQTLWCPDCGAEANLDDTAEFKTPEPQSNLDERIQQAKQQCIEARNLPDAERVAWLADYCRKAAEQMNKDRTDHMEERIQQAKSLKGAAPVPGLDGVPCIHGIPVVVEQKKWPEITNWYAGKSTGVDRNAVAGWFYNAAELGLPDFADIAYDISRMGYLVTVTIGDKISTDFIPKATFLELPDKNAFRHFVNGMVFRMVNEFPS